MDVGLASSIVIVLALAGANLPFFSERVFGVIRWRTPPKPLWLRLLEVCVLYAVVGAAGFALEAQVSNPFPQGWGFYAVSACLFIVFAFPGFVWRYLRKHHP